MEKVFRTGAENENALIDRIISDGNAEAEKILLDAEEYSSNVISAAEAAAEEYISAQRELAKKAASELASGKDTLAALEEKKILLTAKQEIVETVYQRAAAKLCKTEKGDYLKIVDRLVSRYAEKGDKIIISVAAPFSAEEAEALESAVKLGLKAEKTGSFDGGIVLCGKAVDKDLTFKSLVEAVRENTESETAEELFGKGR